MPAAVGTPIAANGVKISVATALAPTVFMPLSLMNSIDISGQESVAEFDVFDSDDPITFAGKQRRTLSAAGYLAEADGGQDALFAAAAGKLTVIVKVLWDATPNGFTQQCRVNAYKGSARAGNQPAEVTFDFIPTTAAATPIGAGPLL